MAVTIYDIARYAGVSHSAVAAVLSGKAARLRISTATANRIRQAAAKLGYRPNALAQAFTSGKTNVIGLVLSTPRREFVGKILAGAMAAANERGLLLKTIAIEEAKLPLAAALDQCLQHRVAAMLICDLQADPGSLPKNLGTELPLCWINCNRQKVGFAVDPDDRSGAIQAVDHLYDLGHRRMAFIAGPKGAVGTVDRRREGFIAAMKAHRVPVRDGMVRYTAWDAGSITEAARALLTRPDRPTAIVCANDPRAGIALQVAQALGLRVPEELSLVGFSDDTLSRYTTPPLTTVRQPHGDIGRLAIKLIADCIEGRHRPVEIPADNLLRTQLLVRDSTAPAPK